MLADLYHRFHGQSRLCRSALLVSIIVLSITLRPVSLGAQEDTRRAPVILTITQSATVDGNAEMQTVVSDVMRLELGRSGVETTSVFELTGQPMDDSLIQITDMAPVFELAVSRQIDFVLVGTFYQEGENFQLSCDIYDPREKTLSASASRNMRIGFTLDDIIAECVGELVTKMAESFADLPPRETEEPIVQRETPPLEEQSVPPERGEVELEEAEEAFRRFQFSLGFAPFLVVGRASDFFKSGLSPSFHGNYWLKLPFGRIGFGLYAALILFAPEDISISSRSFFIPLGADVQFAAGDPSPLSLYLRLSGGPSLLLLNLSDSGTQIKIVFYGLGGIGVNIGITEMFGITVDSSFTMIFEGEEPIMGYSPSVYIDLRL